MSQDEVRYWRNEITASKKRQKDEFVSRVGYDKLVRYYEGLQLREGEAIDAIAIMDEYSPAITSVVTSTYNQNPSVSTKARRPEADGNVKPNLLYLIQNPNFRPFNLTDLMTGAIEYGMDKIGMKEEMQLATFDLLVAGFCAVEVNHAVETEIPTEEEAPMATESPQADAVMNRIGQMAVGAVMAAGKVVNKILGKDETEEKIESELADPRTDFSDATYCKRWNPLKVLFDARAEVFKDSRFVGKIVEMSVAEFNKKYPKFKGRLQPGSEALSNANYQSHRAHEHKNMVTLYELEIRKKTRNCIVVLADGIPDAIDYYEKGIITNGFSIKYGCIDKYGKIYPMSRAAKAKKAQDDINHYLTRQFEHVDRAQRKISVFWDGLTPQGQSAIGSADVYAILPKNTPQPIFEAMPAPSVVPENKEIVMAMTQSINKQFQTNELAKGGESDSEFATQEMLKDKAFQTNTSAVQDAAGDVMRQLLDTLKDIIMQVWDGEDYFKVTGIVGGDQWYTPEMGPLAEILVGDYLIECDIISAQRPNPMKDRAENLELAQFIMNPDTQMYLYQNGKRSNMNVLNNLVKSYNQNPDIVFEDIEEIDPLAPAQPQMPTTPGQAGLPSSPAEPSPVQSAPEQGANLVGAGI